jgi:hypothetical protein
MIELAITNAVLKAGVSIYRLYEAMLCNQALCI